jgi:hypothetical protein
MFYNIFTGNMEAQAPNKFARADKMLLSEAERTGLRLFAIGQGNRIEEDTSLFTGTERNRLAFIQWLYKRGKLSR